MKKVLISFDSFKDCISSIDIGHCVDKSLKDNICDSSDSSDIETEILSISDGGEGLLECLVDSLGLEIKILDDGDIDHMIVGPLGERSLKNTRYAYNKKENYAVIEMAIASGIQLVPESKRSPFNTTTYGTGELIKHAIEIGGFKTIYIGAGGSATNDAGLGALQALGVIEVIKQSSSGDVGDDDDGSIIFGRDIINIKEIKIKNKEKYSDIKFYFLTDVKNPMIGKNGAVYTFSEQKGAKTKEEKEILENGMINISKLYPIDISNQEGTGAAGGLASGFLSIFNENTKIINGMEFVLKSYNLLERIKQFDLIITGEGCWDRSSLDGKVVSEICKLSNQFDIPILIICGKNNLSIESYNSTSFLSNRKNENDIKIIDLLSHFSKDQSLNQTKQCINTLFKTNQSLSSFLKYNLFTK